MKTKTQKMLPKTPSEILNGGIYLQRIRCGKTNCKCARGETHSAFYFYTRRNGKLTKTYVRRADVAEFTRLSDQAADMRLARRRIMKTDLDLLKQMRIALREKAALINSLKGK